MARKRQTTALPKAKKTAEVPATNESPSLRDRFLNRQPVREYKTRAEQEADIQRFVILGTGIAVAFIALILVLAFVNEIIIRPNQAVASVAGTSISAG